MTNAGIRNLGEFWWVQFAVRTTDKNGNYLSNQGIPVLTMERLDGVQQPDGPQVLAEGIEDLQVAFACDLNADGLLSEGQGAGKVRDEWTLNSPNDVIALNRAAKCNQPSAIRLTLVARSLTEDNGIDANQNFNGPPTVENHCVPPAVATPVTEHPEASHLLRSVPPPGLEHHCVSAQQLRRAVMKTDDSSTRFRFAARKTGRSWWWSCSP